MTPEDVLYRQRLRTFALAEVGFEDGSGDSIPPGKTCVDNGFIGFWLGQMRRARANLGPCWGQRAGQMVRLLPHTRRPPGSGVRCGH